MSRATPEREPPAPVPVGQNPIDDALNAAWRGYKSTAAPESRDRLILHYSPLVKYVAGHVAVGLPANIEQADLISYGIFGLIDAIDKYDIERNIKFETYAMSGDRGAIIDGSARSIGCRDPFVSRPGKSRRPTPISRTS